MDQGTAHDRLAAAIQHILDTTDAETKLDELKAEGRRRREREDVVWFELVLSMATWGNSRGAQNLRNDPEVWEAVQWDTVADLDPDEREAHLDEAFREAGASRYGREGEFLAENANRIVENGGVQAVKDALLDADEAKEARAQLTEFAGIGKEYARNIMMDLHHPDFRDDIKLDYRVTSITDALGVTFDDRKDHQQFFLDVADELGRSAWELDRILYNYRDGVLGHLEDRRSVQARTESSRS